MFNTKPKKILVCLGHPNTDPTLCSKLADAYEASAKLAGHSVERINIAELSFDPILHKGYKAIQELEPDLKKVQTAITNAEHLVFIFPTWWAGMPALLKGFFDRIFLPRFAYQFHRTPIMFNLKLWDKLLKGKSARVITTMNNMTLIEKIFVGDTTRDIRKALLNFAGVSPVRTMRIGQSESVTPQRFLRLENKVKKLGKKAK